MSVDVGGGGALGDTHWIGTGAVRLAAVPLGGVAPAGAVLELHVVLSRGQAGDSVRPRHAGRGSVAGRGDRVEGSDAGARHRAGRAGRAVGHRSGEGAGEVGVWLY